MRPRHTVVFHDPKIWAAVPANNGPNGPAWQWGDEVLVGFTTGPFAADGTGHQARAGGPFQSRLARTIDGGDTWTAWPPRGYAGQTATTSPAPDGLDLTAPGFALRVEGHGYHGNDAERWFTSADRGVTWAGPWSLGSLLEDPRLRDMQLTGRTAYIVGGAREIDLYLSARRRDSADGLKVSIAEKPFLARSEDGGRVFRFVSWLVAWEDPWRAVMPAPVRLDDQRFVAAVRRKSATNNWIDCYETRDRGRSWSHLSRVGDTERGNRHNGNPPALIATSRGSLCCVYGNRSDRTIVAKWSDDGGRSWSAAVTIRADFQSANTWPDLGYARLWERPDGLLAAVYFWCTADRPQTHICATVFAP